MAAYSLLAEPSDDMNDALASLSIVQVDGDPNEEDYLHYYTSVTNVADAIEKATTFLQARIKDGAIEVIWRERPQVMQFENGRSHFARGAPPAEIRLVMNYKLKYGE